MIQFLKWLWNKINVYRFFPQEPVKLPLKEVYPEPFVVDNFIAPETNAEKIVRIAKESLGKDMSPKNLAPSELSCAEGLSNLIHEVIPNFPFDVVSTIDLFNLVRKAPKYFEPILKPEPGAIIISPRIGEQAGHCGVFINSTAIVSNSSISGLMTLNYTYSIWIDKFKVEKGLHIYLYKIL